MNTSSIFCTQFSMFNIRIKLMCWVNRREYDNSDSASRLQIRPLLRKLQAFICSTCLRYVQLLCMKTSSILCTGFSMFNIRIKLMYWVNRGEYDNFNSANGWQIDPLLEKLQAFICSTYIQLFCMNTSSIFCTQFNMFKTRIKLMYWVNRGQYDNSNSASRLQIEPLLKKLQPFIFLTCSTYFYVCSRLLFAQ